MKLSTASTKIALCYVQSSLAHSVNYKIQHDNATKICDKHGWESRFYVDVFKSGISAERPAFRKLVGDLTNPNVVAVVVNDLSCLSRNWFDIELLIKKLQNLDIKLILVNSPLREIDIFSMQGKPLLQVLSWADEMYADSIAERARDSVLHRKSRGISIGKPPFGTQRDTNGYLVPSKLGFWLMPDGTWRNGTVSDSPPSESAEWRGDYECAKRIFELYVSNVMGYTRIASVLREEGWAYRNRYHELRQLEPSDIRQVVMSHRVYGGAPDKTSDYRPANAIVGIDLLYAVEKVLETRRVKPHRP